MPASLRPSILMILSFFIPCFLIAQEGNVSPKVFQSGEELHYKVKWNFLRLGSIIVRAKRDSLSTDTSVYRLVMIVRSNPDLGVVNIHEYNESVVSSHDAMSKRYYAKQCNGDDCREIRYSYDEKLHEAYSSERSLSDSTILNAETKGNAPPFVEGPSLFFACRFLAHTGKQFCVPTMVNGTINKTLLDFRFQIDKVNIDGLNRPIRARRYSGSADWKGGGSAGLSGDFTGWVSDDDAAIPIRAELKIFLGSIDIELEKWQRLGWTPPYSESN